MVEVDTTSPTFSPKDLVGIVSPPKIAVPTVILSITVTIVWMTVFGSMVSSHPFLPLWGCFAVNTVCIFIAFTPMHDASHGSIATTTSGMKWLNTAIGSLSSFLFGAPFPAFKYMHLMHHKHTNHDELDPDFWSGSGSTLLLPLRWFTQELRYYYLYLPILHTRPIYEVIATIVQLLLVLGCYYTCAAQGKFFECFLGWILPARIASMALAFSFDYLPHRPHTITREQDPYKATAVTSFVGDVSWPLTWPLLYQNYHNIHHFYPYIPFYQYYSVWKAMKSKLLAAGTDIIPIFGHNHAKSH